jgi:hypothetical protein
VPFALTMDNLAYGVANDYSGSLLGHAAEQAVPSGLLAFAGLVVGAALLPRLERRVDAARLAGGALLLAAGGLALVG